MSLVLYILLPSIYHSFSNRLFVFSRWVLSIQLMWLLASLTHVSSSHLSVLSAEMQKRDASKSREDTGIVFTGTSSVILRRWLITHDAKHFNCQMCKNNYLTAYSLKSLGAWWMLPQYLLWIYCSINRHHVMLQWHDATVMLIEHQQIIKICILWKNRTYTHNIFILWITIEPGLVLLFLLPREFTKSTLLQSLWIL